MYDYSTKSDKKKGKVVEYIVKQILKKLGAETVTELTDLQKQLHLGDFEVIDDKGNKKTVEAKTSHEFRKTKTDKLAMDYKYFESYDRKNKKFIWYKQSNTGNELGWLIDNRADLLIAFNPKSCKAYIIKNFSVVADNILNDVEAYIDSLEEGLITFYKKDYKNYINKYLEGGIKTDYDKDDNILKFAFIVNLDLQNEDGVKKYGGELKTIDIDLHIEIPVYEYRVLTGEIKVKTRRRREERSKIEEGSDKKTTPSTAANCKRRSRF